MTMTLREEALKLHMDNNGKIDCSKQGAYCNPS